MMNKTILIADSGSTKTDWAFVYSDGCVERFQTAGINPLMQSARSISEMLLDSYGNWTSRKIDCVQFYGAGCIGERANNVICEALSLVIGAVNVCVHSDLLGVAHALCGDSSGIVCILGTGANSGEYDGRRIVANTPPLGFILGDEGSGAYIGKRVVSDVFKGQLPSSVKTAMLSWCCLTYEEIIDRVYRQPYPNRFLAGFTKFVKENSDVEELRAVVVDSFRQFAERNLLAYSPELLSRGVNFVGSVAFNFRDELSEALATYGLTLGRVIQSPIDGLVAYYSEKDK